MLALYDILSARLILCELQDGDKIDFGFVDRYEEQMKDLEDAEV